MPGVSWLQTLNNSPIDGTALATSTVATSLLPAIAKPTLPANYFTSAGKLFKLRASGRISTVVTTPGTLTLDMRFGSVVVFNGGAMTLNIVAKTNVGWVLDVDITVRAVGATTTANVIGQGLWTSEAVIGAPLPTVGGATSHVLPYNTAPVVGTGFDSTAAFVVDLFGTWSVSNAANSITCHQFALIDMNMGAAA